MQIIGNVMIGSAKNNDMVEQTARVFAQIRYVRLWLFTVAGFIFLLVFVGGLTRLTLSGLSITEWNPVTGILPPLSHEAWAIAIAKYRAIPQAAAYFPDLTLAQFQFIYLMEWGHRLLARLVGLIFAVPLIYFWVRGYLPRALKLPLIGVMALGGLQGFVGWWMVSSGLADRLEVAHERLATHLLLALITCSALIYLGVGLWPERAKLASRAASRLRWQAGCLVGLALLQIGLGALVAGLHAGLIYNTWPLMDGHVLPAFQALFAMTPWWQNFLDNHMTVQFCHRLGAYTLLALALYHWRQCRLYVPLTPQASQAVILLGLVLLQATLGIVTLLTLVPLPLALLHQIFGALVLATCVLQWRSFITPMVNVRSAINDDFPSDSSLSRAV